jgi:RNA polymerase sigma-70 factor, ECF subfamily
VCARARGDAYASVSEEPERKRVRDPDPRIVQRARRGDLLAFEELVREYQADAFRFAWHLTRHRQMAEDVTQEAFLRAFRFLHGFRGDRRFGSWLFSIVRNCAMDSLRGQRQIPVAWDETVMARSVADPSARAELDAALRAVSSDHRETFLLVEVFGLSYQETADVLGIAVGTVKSRMFRAREALSAAIADVEEGDA